MRNAIFLFGVLLFATGAEPSLAEDGPLKGPKKTYCFAYDATVVDSTSIETKSGVVTMPVVKYTPRQVDCTRETGTKPDDKTKTIELSIRDSSAKEHFDVSKINGLLLRLFANGKVHPDKWLYKNGMQPAPQGDLETPEFRSTADEGPDTVHGCMCWDEEVCTPTADGGMRCRTVRKCSCWNR